MVRRAIFVSGRYGGRAVPLPYHDGHHLVDQRPYLVDLGAGRQPVIDRTGDLLLLRSLGELHRRQEALAELRRLVGGSAGLRGYVIVGHRRLPYAAGSIATRTAPSSGFQPATFSNSNPRCSTSSMRLRI